jgi:type IV secretory pathway TrbD component
LLGRRNRRPQQKALAMSDLEPRSGRGVSRRQREQRAFLLVLTSGGLALAAAVVLVLWIAGVAGFGLFLLLAVLAAVAGYLLKRTLRP